MRPARKQSCGQRVIYRSPHNYLDADRLKTSRRKRIVVSVPNRKAQPRCLWVVIPRHRLSITMKEKNSSLSGQSLKDTIQPDGHDAE